MARFGMVIDLQRCVGCGACAFACKAENNTRTRGEGQSFNWADFLLKTEGTFPATTFTAIPVLCNHCTLAPCVEVCPVKPDKAIYKTPEGITMYDQSLCIGCGRCQRACPYSASQLDETSRDGASYSVISYNDDNAATQPFWADKTPMIAGVTPSAAETAQRAGAPVPTLNRFEGAEVGPLRKPEVIEKCTFCYHRTQNGLQPACVEVCPSHARIFGDQDDPKAEISLKLDANRSFRLKEEKGTWPNVYYVGKYAVRS